MSFSALGVRFTIGRPLALESYGTGARPRSKTIEVSKLSASPLPRQPKLMDRNFPSYQLET